MVTLLFIDITNHNNMGMADKGCFRVEEYLIYDDCCEIPSFILSSSDKDGANDRILLQFSVTTVSLCDIPQPSCT